MKLLLDTHVLLWLLLDDSRIPADLRSMVENVENVIYYSIVSPWEIEIKRLAHPEKMELTAERLIDYCAQSGFCRLPIREEHLFLLKTLQRPETEPPHRDPFDRVMICQAKYENMLFVTHDRLIAGYSEPLIYCV